MNIKIGNPPNIEEIKSLLDISKNDKIIYTYGDTIYNPNNIEIPDHLYLHEFTHFKQQGNDPDKWWKRYLKEVDFRISQEVEAYGEQYKFICRSIKDRNKREKILGTLASLLSSEVYGQMIDSLEAKKRIRNYKF